MRTRKLLLCIAIVALALVTIALIGHEIPRPIWWTL